MELTHLDHVILHTHCKRVVSPVSCKAGIWAKKPIRLLPSFIHPTNTEHSQRVRTLQGNGTQWWIWETKCFISWNSTSYLLVLPAWPRLPVLTFSFQPTAAHPDRPRQLLIWYGCILPSLIPLHFQTKHKIYDQHMYYFQWPDSLIISLLPWGISLISSNLTQPQSLTFTVWRVQGDCVHGEKKKTFKFEWERLFPGQRKSEDSVTLWRFKKHKAECWGCGSCLDPNGKTLYKDMTKTSQNVNQLLHEIKELLSICKMDYYSDIMKCPLLYTGIYWTV